MLTLQFPKTAKITDFLGNQELIQNTPPNRTPKFVYKQQILKPDDTLESIGYNPEEQVAITVVYISSRENMINYIFICLKPDGSEIIKSIPIDRTITFDELKDYIKLEFDFLSDEFKLNGANKEINSIDDLFNILPTVPIVIGGPRHNPIKGGRRRRSSTPRKSSTSRRRRSTKRRTASRKQQKRRRGSRRAH